MHCKLLEVHDNKFTIDFKIWWHDVVLEYR